MPRKGKKRLTIDIPESFHNALKNIAKKHNITLSKIIIKLIILAMMDDYRYE